jgi:hypothetical protein
LNQLLGDNHTPDLQGQFIRGATGPLDNYTKHRWTTARPRSQFTGTSNHAGNHTHTYQSGAGSTSGIKGGDWNSGEIGWGLRTNTSSTAGDHFHTVVISGGGDTETAPDHVILNFIIKAEDQNLGRRII